MPTRPGRPQNPSLHTPEGSDLLAHRVIGTAAAIISSPTRMADLATTPSTTLNPVADPASSALAQQEEQRRREAERAVEERRAKENQDKLDHDNRLPNTVAPMAPAAPVINPEGFNAAMILNHMRTIDPLKGTNNPAWRKEIDMLLTLADLDYSIQIDRPTEPQMGDHLYDEKMLHYSIEKKKWEFSNTKCLKIVRHLIDDSIEGSIPECTTAKELLDRLRSQFTGSSKAYASALVDDFTNMRCDSSGVRAYIQKMTSTAAKLNKYLGKDLPEEFVVHMIMKSLPKEYETFHVHYNTTIKDRWTIDQLMAQCLQEEERLKSHKGDSINYASNQLKKMNKSSKPTFKKGPKGDEGQSSCKAPALNYNHGRGVNLNKFFPVPVDTCLYCKQKGHYKKDCPDYLRSLLKRDEGLQNKKDAGKGNKKR